MCKSLKCMIYAVVFIAFTVSTEAAMELGAGGCSYTSGQGNTRVFKNIPCKEFRCPDNSERQYGCSGFKGHNDCYPDRAVNCNTSKLIIQF